MRSESNSNSPSFVERIYALYERIADRLLGDDGLSDRAERNILAASWYLAYARKLVPGYEALAKQPGTCTDVLMQIGEAQPNGKADDINDAMEGIGNDIKALAQSVGVDCVSNVSPNGTVAIALSQVDSTKLHSLLETLISTAQKKITCD